MIMELAGKFTWWGINDKKFPFYNTVLSQAIFQAVATNRYYPKPTREEFQREVVGSLKIAKQRILNARGRHPGLSENRRNLEEAANALYNEDANHLQANKLVQNADNNHREMESEIESDDSNES